MKRQRRRVRTREGAVRAIIAALRPLGFEPVVPDNDDEPVVSIQLSHDEWLDVFVRHADA